MTEKMQNADPSSWPLSRREMLRRSGTGFGLLGLAGVLAADGALASAAEAAPGGTGALAPKSPHFAGKAQRVVHLFMNGGPSHVDTFDPKPLLDKHHGQPLPASLRTERKTGAAMRSPFKFARYGQSGIEVSELFAKTARHVDDMCIIRSMAADVPNHEPSLMLMNCGDGRLPRPSFGAWVTYGLGSENQNLPGFIAMCPGGYPIVATQNWRASFLPGAYQGTYIDTKHTDLDKLIENIRNKVTSPADQRRQLDLVARLNSRHLAARPDDARLEARIESFELAYRMQSEAAEAFDLEREPPAIREAYTTGLHGRQLLITRRLLERGVRFVQVWSGQGQPWDNHDNLEKQHRQLAGRLGPANCRVPGRFESPGHARQHAGDVGRRVWPHAGGRAAAIERPRPQSLRFFDVAGRRRRVRRLRSRRDRRLWLRRRREPRPRARPARHAVALARLRSYQAHLPLRRPRFPADRRGGAGGEGTVGLTSRSANNQLVD